MRSLNKIIESFSRKNNITNPKPIFPIPTTDENDRSVVCNLSFNILIIVNFAFQFQYSFQYCL
jgi:hypothetical protein